MIPKKTDFDKSINDNIGRIICVAYTFQLINSQCKVKKMHGVIWALEDAFEDPT